MSISDISKKLNIDMDAIKYKITHLENNIRET